MSYSATPRGVSRINEYTFIFLAFKVVVQASVAGIECGRQTTIAGPNKDPEKRRRVTSLNRFILDLFHLPPLHLSLL
jgi:hypothetical protein